MISARGKESKSEIRGEADLGRSGVGWSNNPAVPEEERRGDITVGHVGHVVNVDVIGAVVADEKHKQGLRLPPRRVRGGRMKTDL